MPHSAVKMYCGKGMILFLTLCASFTATSVFVNDNVFLKVTEIIVVRIGNKKYAGCKWMRQ